MPRTLSTELLNCLDRENPRVEIGIELSVPDVSRVLRRPDDQLLLSPDPQVSLTPAASLVSVPGGISLASTSATLVSFLAGGSGPMNVDKEDPTTRIKGVSWAVDPAFDAARIRSFTARLRRSSSLWAPAFELQIYRASGRWGVLTKPDGTQRNFFYWEFAPQLSNPVVVQYPQQTWVANVADVAFDLTGQNMIVDGTKEALPSNQNNGLANYYFSVRQVGTAPPGSMTWQGDAVTSPAVAGIGSFAQTWWSRTRAGDAWAQTVFAQVPQCSIQVENYAPAGGYAEAVYKIDLARAPSAGAVGRIYFQRGTPLGTTLTAELSTAGSGGPFTPVLDGDILGVAQQLYHLRVRLTPNASRRSTPTLGALGIEFMTLYDIGRISILEPLSSDVAVPFMAAEVGSGSLTILRDGRRDYADDATVIASLKAATKLQVDYYLISSHPRVTRDKWLRLGRATVSDRTPSETSEKLTLLSYLSMMLRKIPLPQETINQVVTVNDLAHGAAADPTPTRVYVTPALAGATAGGTEYTGKGYYMRVQRSSQVGVGTGTVALISSHTSAVALNFGAGVLNGTLAYGDVLEVHSGVVRALLLTWKDWDPADVWWDILVNQLQNPPERVGMGHLPRGGLPPKVTDRAPSDVTTQAKCKVSLSLEDGDDADKLIDQLSFIMGGATIEIAGQICFVQIYPLRDANGFISVPLPAASRVIDPRDYANASFPVGLASRVSAVTCKYGIDTTVVESMQFAPSQVEVADADAITWLTLSPTDNRGRTDIPDEIARWMYNTTDSGLFLAAELCHQIVAYFSTGMRVWEWTERNAHPENHAGDVIAVTQDRYTDYDPTGGVPIAGWKTFNVILLGASADGRKFRGIVPGIQPTIVQSVGQGGGVVDGPVPIKDGRRHPFNIHGGVGSLQDTAAGPLSFSSTVGVATIFVAAHTVLIAKDDSSATVVSYPSGSFTMAGARGVETYVYRDDPLATGAGSYGYTQTPNDPSTGLVKAGRYYIGHGIIPAGINTLQPMTSGMTHKFNT